MDEVPSRYHIERVLTAIIVLLIVLVSFVWCVVAHADTSTIVSAGYPQGEIRGQMDGMP